ncbi:hypothetical protein GCM10010168_58280 [Actinoplanes ianthinogenes]|uniref:DUF7144 domain-containing protein n=1 Tax=Actinoplanes ianthinogenes TaxID=122358 RepID=A0ABM7M283_9ACTN|nr:hypothetical protein [Actinoplanes ianthinogenes]BCJ45752.1 hypothetical protein Aiant_64090 [Actinoplanes ianthinogenes]GGR32205.1 hypothetical protein GCM10010168_58280 [Actinoplanes ianthinogenes]
MTTSNTSYARPQQSPWVGMVLFSGVLLILLGAFQVIDGLVTLFRDDIKQATADHLAIPINFTAWGWTHLILGALTVLVGIGVLRGNTFARAAAVLLAMVSTFANLVYLPVYPFWCSIVVALNIICIYAIVAHGRELRA